MILTFEINRTLLWDSAFIKTKIVFRNFLPRRLLTTCGFPALYFKKRLWHRFSPAKFLRTPFLQNTSGRLLLHFGMYLLTNLETNLFQQTLKYFYIFGINLELQMENYNIELSGPYSALKHLHSLFFSIR